MARYEEKRLELSALGATVFAASADDKEKAREIADTGITYPVAFGVTQAQANLFGAWWDDHRCYIQPTEFLLGRGGVVLGSMYASGPVGRMTANEVIQQIESREHRLRQSGRRP